MNPVDLELPAATELPNPFRDPIGVVERHWRWMLAAFAVGVLASLALWSRSEPRYFAEATVVVASQQVSERIVEPTVAEALPVTEALTAVVLSRNNLSQVVAEFALYPELRGVETMAEIVDRVRSQVSISAVQRLEAPVADGTERAYSIGFEAGTPEAAAGVANRLASLFAETSSADRLQRQQLTTAVLHRELTRAEGELGDRTRAIDTFKQENRGLLPSDLRANLARMGLLQDQRQSLAQQIAEAGTRVATLASQDHSSPELQLGVLRDELIRLRTRQTSRHPDVIDLERRIAELEKGAVGDVREGEEKSPRGLRRDAERTLIGLRQQLAATEKELALLEARIERMPRVQEELASLEQQASISRENYLEFLRKVQNAELGGNLLDAQQGRRVSVLNQAEPPSRPVGAPLRYLALGLVASLGLAVAVGAALELLNPVVLSPDDILGSVGQPVLGWVTRIH